MQKAAHVLPFGFIGVAAKADRFIIHNSNDFVPLMPYSYYLKNPKSTTRLKYFLSCITQVTS
jgi:hypothetical protein